MKLSLTGINRKVIIKRNANDSDYYTYFYYKGFPDHNWKRGCNDCPMDVHNTIKSAKDQALRYIKKDFY